MRRLTVAELREAFLNFFEERGHSRYRSASLIPENDPTTLFTVAGMAQFKDMFLGRGDLPFSRATTCQKCIRTNDIMQVGRTPRHHTFFEMLGNFSFNDYFKEEVIAWAWEFLTKVLGMPGERLWVSVHHTDDEAYAIWNEQIGVPGERLVRMGDGDNFWPAGAPADGPTGPGGYCSEIFWDYQTNDDPSDSPANEVETGRFVEIWNLVFPQFDVSEPKVEGRYTLKDLGRRNIDTGSGLERLACVLQGKTNNFDTDLFQTIIRGACEVAGVEYVEGATAERDGSAQVERNVLLRRIADHVRAVVFCIADGALPGNTGRGYIVRRLIRRATLDLDRLGCDQVGLYRIVAGVVTTMGEAYPAVAERQALATDTLKSEETLFRRTLARGLDLLHKALQRHRSEGAASFSGDDAFDLFTTYGFPYELTEELVDAEGLAVDRARFDVRMAEFAEISKGGREIEVFARSDLLAAKSRLGATAFIGYDDAVSAAQLQLLEVEGVEVDEAASGTAIRFAL
ncbi:MAG: alanine--tRNA ligase, partial [Planctomycetota bacterium]